MKQKSELSRYLADPNWRDKEAEREKQFRDALEGVPARTFGTNEGVAPSTPPMEQGKKEKV